jgi:hypothetical protein
MNDPDSFALVPRPPGSLERAAMGPKRLCDRIAPELLALAKREQPTPVAAKFRVGDYNFCAPDHRQILSWAEQQGLSPEEVIGSLLDGEKPSGVPWAGTVFENGRIRKLNWDFDSMCVPDLTFIDGLQITHLSLCSSEYAFAAEEADEIEIVGFKNLEQLFSIAENLPHFKLTLSDLPLLTHFSCWETPFFDSFHCNCISVPSDPTVPFNPASFAPNLQVLECHGYIDVRSLLHLEKLICDGKILQRPDQHFNE